MSSRKYILCKNIASKEMRREWLLMQNKLPKLFDKHKICVICEGNEEYEYLERLKALKVWNSQYENISDNAGGNGNICVSECAIW